MTTELFQEKMLALTPYLSEKAFGVIEETFGTTEQTTEADDRFRAIIQTLSNKVVLGSRFRVPAAVQISRRTLAEKRELDGSDIALLKQGVSGIFRQLLQEQRHRSKQPLNAFIIGENVSPVFVYEVHEYNTIADLFEPEP